MVPDGRNLPCPTPVLGSGSNPLRPVDPVEAALSEALLRASRDGHHDVVLALAAEIRARRFERQQVIDLNAERERRGR